MDPTTSHTTAGDLAWSEWLTTDMYEYDGREQVPQDVTHLRCTSETTGKLERGTRYGTRYPIWYPN